jgi:hypothetical protein
LVPAGQRHERDAALDGVFARCDIGHERSHVAVIGTRQAVIPPPAEHRWGQTRLSACTKFKIAVWLFDADIGPIEAVAMAQEQMPACAEGNVRPNLSHSIESVAEYTT